MPGKTGFSERLLPLPGRARIYTGTLPDGGAPVWDACPSCAGGSRAGRLPVHADPGAYAHACRYYDAYTGAAANTRVYRYATTHADASGSATSGACSSKSYGYGYDAYTGTTANTYVYCYATTHGYARARTSKGHQGAHAPHDG